MIQWVAVTVMVPVTTNNTSPSKAENDAIIIMEKLLRGQSVRVSSARWSYKEGQ